MDLFLNVSNHETIIQKGITCKKIPYYMRDSACSGLLLKKLKDFEVMLNELRNYDYNYFLCPPQNWRKHNQYFELLFFKINSSFDTSN